MRWRRGWNILSSANFYCKTAATQASQASNLEESVRLTKWHQYFFSVSLKFGAHYITGQFGQFIKKCYLKLFRTFFWHFFVFHHEICVFINFISFFDQASNFRKRKLVVSNCQWDCVHHEQQKALKSSFILRKIVYFFTKILNYFALLIALVESELKLVCWCTCYCE